MHTADSIFIVVPRICARVGMDADGSMESVRQCRGPQAVRTHTSPPKPSPAQQTQWILTYLKLMLQHAPAEASAGSLAGSGFLRMGDAAEFQESPVLALPRKYYTTPIPSTTRPPAHHSPLPIHSTCTPPHQTAPPPLPSLSLSG